MASIWQSLTRAANGPSAASAKGDALPYDEERLERGRPSSRPSSPWRWPTKQLRFSRLRRGTPVWLIVTDVVVVSLLILLCEPLITLLLRNNELFAPRMALYRPDEQDALHHPDRFKIPRILHQTCANETIRPDWIEPQRSCQKAYEGFEYKLWTDESARNFIAEEYPWFLSTWDTYAFPIQRADSIRYFILHHFGGIYLDMDTYCNEPFPVEQLEAGKATHHALFKSTLPTGVTNDFMITSARHPAYAAAISKLPAFHTLTRFWARLEPYAAIMMSSGPLFLTLAVKDYLLAQPTLPSPTVQVIDPPSLEPYITDLESSSWHRTDTHALMWLGDRPWTWFCMGAIGLLVGIYLFNFIMLRVLKAARRVLSVPYKITFG